MREGGNGGDDMGGENSGDDVGKSGVIVYQNQQSCEFEIFFFQVRLPTVSLLFPNFTFIFSPSPPSPLASGLTWCHPATLNFGIQHIVH